MKKTKLIILALIFATIAQVMSDLYLPSLPAIQVAMHTTIHLVQLTISLYVFGFAFSQLIYAPLSDAVGRRIPLIIGMSIAVIGSWICVAANSVDTLIAGRFLQGLGAGAGLGLSRAILRDVLSGARLAKIGSFFFGRCDCNYDFRPLIRCLYSSIFWLAC